MSASIAALALLLVLPRLLKHNDKSKAVAVIGNRFFRINGVGNEKMEGILICTDLDGTLFTGNREISQENRQAIEYFKANGGPDTKAADVVTVSNDNHAIAAVIGALERGDF